MITLTVHDGVDSDDSIVESVSVDGDQIDDPGHWIFTRPRLVGEGKTMEERCRSVYPYSNGYHLINVSDD